MDALAAEVDRVAMTTRFSGVVRVDIDGATALERAFGLANRQYEIPNTVATQFAIASGSKAFTALAVVALIDAGSLRLDTSARSVLGADLPLIDDEVTVEQLLAHRSGIGDYLDEDAMGSVNDFVLSIPVHELADTERFIGVIDGFPTTFAAGSKFAYCNGGYIVLALIAERASGVPFHDLVDRTVFVPAGMSDTSYLRSDELPGNAAIGYLGVDGLRSNVFHLPVRGNGDGGAYSTGADIHRFWGAFFSGEIVPEPWAREMVRPRSSVPDEKRRYGLGFWLDGTSDAVILDGYDAGVSFRTLHDAERRITFSILANTSDGAWPVARRVRELVLP